MNKESSMYQLHPLCSLFPRMDGAEFSALVADIKANGQREPIILHDGMILDGGNRYRACLEAEVEPHFMKFGGGNLVTYVLSANLHRRHLSAGQQAAIVASATDWGKAQTVGKPKSGNSAGLETVADRQAQSGASEKTQRLADKVAKADPDLAKQVAHGEISLAKAVEKVDPKPKVEPEYNPNDPDTKAEELTHALQDAEKEVNSLNALVKSLESKDGASEIAKLHERIRGLEGRLQQEMTTKNEAMKSAQQYKGLLDKIMKKLGVGKHGDILGAIK